MSEITYGYKKKNTKLLKKAEAIAEKLSINLRYFYENKVEFKDEFSDIKKITYDELSIVDSSEANNRFTVIVQDLGDAEHIVNKHYSGDVDAWVKDEDQIEKVMGSECGINLLLANIEINLKNICKTIETLESK